jgi:hypothetical protein
MVLVTLGFAVVSAGTSASAEEIAKALISASDPLVPLLHLTRFDVQPCHQHGGKLMCGGGEISGSACSHSKVMYHGEFAKKDAYLNTCPC